MKRKVYGYGIVDKKGTPWIDESCVCEDRGTLDDICRDLNEFGRYSEKHDHRIPYRVVTLLKVSN